MIGWWILGILLLVLLLLCLTRVGVLIRFGEELTVSARFGFLKFQVLPEKKKPPKNEKKTEETQKKQTQKQEKPKKAFPKPTLSDIRDAWKALWPPLKKALRRTRRGIRIDPLDVSVILGGQAEPADAAQLYGELHGAVWTGMPVLEQLLVIPRPHIHLDVDFTAEETKILGSVGFSARIGTLLRIGMTVAIPGLRWLLAYMEKKSPLRDVMNSTMEKVREMVDANNIVGAPITTPDGVTLIPISRVSFGFGSGGGDYGKPGQNNFGGGGGAGVKIDPVAFLVIKDGTTRVMPVAVPPVSTVDRIVDMAPDIVDKIGKFFDKKDGDETV